MAKIAKRELLQPFFNSSRLEGLCDDIPEPSAALLEQSVDELAHEETVERDGLRSALHKIAFEFATDRQLRCLEFVPGEQKQILQSLAAGGDVLVHLDALAPEFEEAVCALLVPEDAAWVRSPVGEPAGIKGRIRRAATRVARDYEPDRGRAPDLALETAIDALIDLLEPRLGRELIVVGNKNNGLNGPTPGCAGTRVIDRLMRHMDPRLATTTVMNMITKVRTHGCSRDPVSTLIECNLAMALDLSLLPKRGEALAELRRDPINSFA